MYQKSHHPQSDPQGGHSAALKEQGAHNHFSIKEATESSGRSKFEKNQVQHQLMVAYPNGLSGHVQTVVVRSKVPFYFQHITDNLSFSTLHSSASSSSSITACKGQSNLLICPCAPAIAAAPDIRQLLGLLQGLTLGLAENVAKERSVAFSRAAGHER